MVREATHYMKIIFNKIMNQFLIRYLGGKKECVDKFNVKKEKMSIENSTSVNTDLQKRGTNKTFPCLKMAEFVNTDWPYKKC